MLSWPCCVLVFNSENMTWLLFGNTSIWLYLRLYHTRTERVEKACGEEKTENTEQQIC